MFAADRHSNLVASIAGQRPLLIGIGLMVFAVILGSLFFLGFESTLGAMERPYLVPWVIATGLTLVAPLVFLYRRGEFTLIHPLVLLTVTYLFPIFFVGGWSLVFGWSNFYYLSYVDDPEWNFQLTFAYIIIACISLSIGMLLPVGKWLGLRCGKLLPTWDFTVNELLVLGTAFLAVGIFLLVTSIDAGTTGYQGLEFDSLREVGSLGTFLGMVLPASSVFLWIAFFKLERWSVLRFGLLIFLIVVGLFAGVSSGAKAGLMSGFIGILLAFVLAKRKVNVRQWFLIGFASFIILFFGFTFASSFRENKGLERTSVEVYYQVAINSIAAIQEEDIASQFTEFVRAFLERIEVASSLAVVVSNHEVLARYEQAYGLDNNIWQATWLGFIPRFVWSDKPVIGDNRAFNQLYLDTEWSGFAITSIGDLLRNFGPAGIPIGMFLLGFLLRVFYSALIEGGNLESWKGVLFCVVIARVNLEGFYGHIVPSSIRIAVIVALQIAVMRILVLLYRAVGSKPL